MLSVKIIYNTDDGGSAVEVIAAKSVQDDGEVINILTPDGGQVGARYIHKKRPDAPMVVNAIYVTGADGATVHSAHGAILG